jgi:hypothetical protein
MTLVVHKYDLGPQEAAQYEIDGYEALVRRGVTMDLAVQARRVCLWRLVEDSEDEYRVRYLVRGTGDPVPYDCIPVGTVHSTAGGVSLCWHFFEQRV